MLRTMRVLPALGLLFVTLPFVAVAADEKDETVVNPRYAYWAKSKPGAVAVHVEKNVLGGEEKAAFPDGVDEKTITYTLLSVSEEKVVIRVVVSEKEHLGFIEAAPTKMTYLAKVKKSLLASVLDEFGAKSKDEEVTVKVGEKEIKCKVLAGTVKKEAEVVEHKLLFSPEVPGGVVMRMRKVTQAGKLVAETTTTLKSYKEGIPKKGKEPK